MKIDDFTFSVRHLGNKNFKLVLMCVVRPQFNSVFLIYHRVFHHIGTTCGV